MGGFLEISTKIKSDLGRFEKVLLELNSGEEGSINEILEYLFKEKGKRIRPALIYLCSRFNGEPNQSTDIAALIVELMHTATLLHDDVIDDANLRRNVPTVNKKWDNKTAILVGDYLFAKAMKIATDNKEYNLFDLITPAIMSLSVGELQQLSFSSKIEINREKYFEIIKNKTASLISVCCEVGYNTTASEDKEGLKIIKTIGEKLGIIFQIKDDILDYVGNSIGKNIGQDIKESKITLPLICAWDYFSDEDKQNLVDVWNNEELRLKNIPNIIANVVKCGGIQQSYLVIEKIKQDILIDLSYFSKNKNVVVVKKLVDYIMKSYYFFLIRKLSIIHNGIVS